MPPSPIYLDHNATAPILPEVADAVRDAALRYPGNPASQHEAGRQARRALERARERIGEILGARTTGMDADQIIFTSGGTESNHLALHGLLARAGPSPAPAPRLIISAIEHPSVARTAETLANTYTPLQPRALPGGKPEPSQRVNERDATPGQRPGLQMEPQCRGTAESE